MHVGDLIENICEWDDNFGGDIRNKKASMLADYKDAIERVYKECQKLTKEELLNFAGTIMYLMDPFCNLRDHESLIIRNSLQELQIKEA